MTEETKTKTLSLVLKVPSVVNIKSVSQKQPHDHTTTSPVLEDPGNGGKELLATYESAVTKLYAQLSSLENRDEVKEAIASAFPRIGEGLAELLHTSLNHKDQLLSTIALEHACQLKKEEEGATCVDLFAAYQQPDKSDKWNPTFVLLDQRRNAQANGETFLKLNLKRRYYKGVSKEAEEVVKHAEVRKTRLSLSDEDLICKALESNDLSKMHSKVTLVSACTHRSSSGGEKLTPEVCIVVYVLLKGYIPFDEEPFPRSICKISVDVREGYPIFGTKLPSTSEQDIEMEDVEPEGEVPESSDSNAFNRKLLLGTGIGPKGAKIKGTLGGFVQLCDESIGILTCSHVIGDAKIICQPADDDVRHLNIRKSFECAKVAEVAFDEGSSTKVGVDALVARITDKDRIPERGCFVNVAESQLLFAGFHLRDKPDFSKGKSISVRQMTDDQRQQCVYKVGRATGLTKGAVAFRGLIAKEISEEIKLHDKGIYKFYKQLEVCPTFDDETTVLFFDLGDSGSLVFSRLNKELYCIGLAIGLTNYKTCIVTPIEEVLKRLNVTLYNFEATTKSVCRKRPRGNNNAAAADDDGDDDNSRPSKRPKLETDNPAQSSSGTEIVYDRQEQGTPCGSGGHGNQSKADSNGQNPTTKH